MTNALAYAVRKKNEEMIDLLLKYEVDYTSINIAQIPAIYLAVDSSRIDILKRLIELGTDPNINTHWASAVLRRAVHKMDKEYLITLLEAGIEVDSADSKGVTALQVAIELSDIDAVRMLLDAGADIKRSDYLRIASRRESTVFQMLMEHAKSAGQPVTAQPWLLEEVTHTLSLDTMINLQLLLREGIPVDSCSLNGRYALETAILQNNDYAIKILLQHGASIEIPVITGVSILHVAVEFGTNEAVRILLKERNCDLDKRDYHGNTVLRSTFLAGNRRKMKLLLEAGAELYPPGQLVRYAYPDQGLPPATVTYYIPSLAREVMQGRRVNWEDVLTLRDYHEEWYQDFEMACQEWDRAQETFVNNEITCADLIEKSTTELITLSRAKRLYRHQSAYNYRNKFPIYGISMTIGMGRLLKRRARWIGNEKKLEAIMHFLPYPIVREIAYHMASD